MPCVGMGRPIHTPEGNFSLEVTPDEKVHFEKALTDWLVGAEPDYRVMREMNVRLRCATRKRQGGG